MTTDFAPTARSAALVLTALATLVAFPSSADSHWATDPTHRHNRKI